MRRELGLTVLELVISLGILALVTVYLLNTFTVNQQAYSVVEQTTEVQQNLRAAADLLERDIRHAGFMVPAGGAYCAVDDFNGPDILYVSDPNALDPSLLGGAENGAAFAGNNVNDGGIDDFIVDLVLEPGVGNPAYDNTGDGVPDSDFLVDAGAILTDRDDPSRGAACGRVELIDLATGRLRVEIESGDLATGTGADLVAIPAIEYRVVGDVLLRNGLEMVRGVDDFQLAFFVDLNDDNIEAPAEMYGDGDFGPDFDPSLLDLSLTREIRISLIMRTRSEDPGFPDGQFQALENRVAIAGNDGFRRRTYTARELLRNLVAR